MSKYGFLWVSLCLFSCKSHLLLQASHLFQRSCVDASECSSGAVCMDSLCVNTQALCSALNPAGVCPKGQGCRRGVCVQEGQAWCACEPSQGCVQGKCVQVDASSVCMPGQMWGVCPEREVCVGGYCVPLEKNNMCAWDNPDGWCVSGAACVSGMCAAVSSVACSAAHPEGVCAPGHGCVSGVCVPRVCSAAHPLGVCEYNETCKGGVCEAVPCSPTHPLGACARGDTYCSMAGRCIEKGLCAHDADCGNGQWCGSQGRCLQENTCDVAQDCRGSERMVCNNHRCAQDNSCDALKPCPQGRVCSPAQRCVPQGQCLDRADCSAGKYCSVLNTCVDEGMCAADADCAEGTACVQGACEVPASLQCNSNTFVSVGCSAGASRCCEQGRVCCGTGQTCSALGGCIETGRCTSDVDCLQGFYTCQQRVCVPNRACSSHAECGSGEKCSYTGACIPQQACTNHADCGSGYRCGPRFSCEAAQSCGVTQFSTTLVQPNVLIVLDRSGSMNLCDGDRTTRWVEASGAVEAILAAYGDRIRFGLSTFPARCESGRTCSQTCGDWFCDNQCGASVNCLPGLLDVPIAENNAALILGSMVSNTPGGYTPTGFTMQRIADRYREYGLPSLGDTASRAQYVLLVTDGDVNCFQGGTNDSPSRVNNALQKLAQLPSSVRTFVVGFAFGGRISSALNCHAVYGGTQKCSGTVDTRTCASTSEQCYYSANNAPDLLQAFRSIAGQVASCTYTLEKVPPDIQRLYVQLQDRNGVRSGYLTRGVDWNLSSDGLTLSFMGDVCNAIKERSSSPVVVYGCPDLGG